jgi:hypothetical protein
MKTTKESFEDAIPKPHGIYFKMWKAKQQIGKASKNAKNPHFKSNYVDINSALEAIEPILLENGLLLIQPIKDGNVFSIIIDTDTNETIESFMRLPDILDPQKIGSAITYYRRYTLLSLCSMQSEDDDSNSASDYVKNTKPSITEDRFQNGLKQVDNGDMTKEEFKKILSKFQLTESQTKTIALL